MRATNALAMSSGYLRESFARAQAYLVASMFLALAQTAHSSCTAPRFSQIVPTPPMAESRADVPECLSGYVSSGQHTCSAEELNTYRSALRAYIHQVATYAMAAASFATAARTFASDAQRFAKCEVGRAGAQHELPRR
jgi:hypothetical protein